MPTTGMRPSTLGANKWSMMALPTGWPGPLAGLICDNSPGLALTSITAARWLFRGKAQSCSTMSTPAMSRPTTRAASAAAAATVGCTNAVTSSATLPLRWISTRWPRAGTDWAFSPTSSSSRMISSLSLGFTTLSGESSPRPRRGSQLICNSASWSMVCTPSPSACKESPHAAATTFLPTTNRRCSLPGMYFSTMTALPLPWRYARW